MGDRLAAANGKRHRAWGTRQVCDECGRCLCYACHPEGPCVEDRLEGLSRPMTMVNGTPAVLQRSEQGVSPV